MAPFGDQQHAMKEMAMKLMEKIAKIREGAHHDLDSAILQLETLRHEKGFFPWGAFDLAKLYREVGRRSEMQVILSEIFETEPYFFQVWDLYSNLYDNADQQKRIAELMLVRVSTFEGTLPKWLRRPLMQALFICFHLEIDQFLRILKHNNIISSQEMHRIEEVHRFAKKLNISSDIKFLRFGFRFCGSQKDASFLDDRGELIVNMSHLAINDLDSCGAEICKAFMHGLKINLGNKIYVEDFGTDSWGCLTNKDMFSILFMRLCAYHAASFFTIDRRLMSVKGSLMQTPPTLSVRPGAVEMWVLWNYQHDKIATLRAARTAIEDLVNEEIDNIDKINKSPWWPRIDPVENVKRLMANAGWYSDLESAADVFEHWADGYLDALASGQVLNGSIFEFVRIATFDERVRMKNLIIYSEKDVFDMLNKKNVVVISPFVQEIEEQHATGNVEKIWSTNGYKLVQGNLEVVEAPMTIWPYSCDRNWTETFNSLLNKSLDAIDKISADTVLASCGCYGLPLMNELFKRRKITCSYIGHVTNMYFGISTGAFANYSFMAKSNIDFWRSGNLEARYPLVSRVDAGRYSSG